MPRTHRKNRIARYLVAAFLGFGFPAVAAQDAKLTARGVVLPNATNTLAVDLVARVTQIPFRDGQRFRQGDTLVAFNCSRYLAQHKAAKANHKAEEALFRQAKTLKNFNAGGATAVSVSAAKAERAAAEAEAIAITVKQCEIKAPYSGRIVERLVEPFDLPSANEPLLKIVDDSRLEIELLVPSQWLQWIEAGSEFEFVIEEAGATFPCKVTQIAAIVDPVSQTIKISGEFVEEPKDVLPGMSGLARFRAASGTGG